MSRTLPANAIAEARAHFDAGDSKPAEKLCRRILKSHKNDVGALVLLGRIHRSRSEYRQGVEVLRKANKHAPEDSTVLAELGLVYQGAGEIDRAIAAYEEAVSRDSSLPQVRYLLGRAYLEANNSMAAVRMLEALHLEVSENEHYQLALANALLRYGDGPTAMTHLRNLLVRFPGEAALHSQLAHALRLGGEAEAAIDAFDRALKFDPHLIDARNGKAHVLESQGKSAEALELVEPAINRGELDLTTILSFVRSCKALNRYEDALSIVDAVLGSGCAPRFDQITLGFRRGELLEATDAHDDAFVAFRKANELQGGRWDARADTSRTDCLIDVFSRDMLESTPRANNESELPVFVLGMPRSGTSLVESIIAAHPQAFGASELLDINRIAGRLTGMLGIEQTYPESAALLTPEITSQCADEYLAHLRLLGGPDALRVTDKMPHNYRHIGLIQLLFPKARIIHCTRDPMDTCLSCYTCQLPSQHTYSTNLRSLGQAYREYERVMRHWAEVIDLPMLTLSYEELVNNPDERARELIEFVGLPWDDACLRYYESKRTVATLSEDQVRKPVYSSSMGRWKRFEGHLEPLRLALDGE